MTTNDERRIKILEYVMERQRTKQNTTKSDVMRHMKEKRLASGETTHNIIKDLINEGKLNKKEINSQVHFLTVNENWDIYKIQFESLKSLIEKEWKRYPDILKNNEIMIEGKPTSEGAYSIGVTLKKRKELVKKKVKSNSKKQVTD
ncbi:MAG: hypothetical protein WBN72_11870 [Nitrososphaeraceae archaeon]